MFRYLAVFIFCFCVQNAFSQSIPGTGANRVRISEPDRSLYFEVDPIGGDIDVKSGLIYYWYSANKIHTTQGGYSGKLLNGEYAEFYPSKNLKEQGGFKSGLKDGLWKEWAESGVLVQATTWINGVTSGSFSKFDENGVLKQYGNYDKGQLNGKLYNYFPKDSVQVLYYRKGMPVPQKPPFFKRVFSKKNHGRDSTQAVRQ